VSTLRIDPRYCGPPGAANGGTLAGQLAAELGDEAVRSGVEVTLRAPAPLGRDLDVRVDREEAVLHDGETEIARARAVALTVEPPAAPDVTRIDAARGRCRAFETHPFPRCFVCGPERPDGLAIFPGVVGQAGGGPLVAASWRPAADLADGDGVHPAFLWAALDCPTAFPTLEDPAVARALEPMVLGRMACAVQRRPAPGESLRVLAWEVQRSGRKAVAEAALVDDRARTLAVARATWISLARP